jgi:hypothetical protein
MIGFNDLVSFLLPSPQVYPVRIAPRSWISCQVLKDERNNRMASRSEMRRYLVEYLAGRQSLIREQVVFAIRSSAEISSSERLTDQQLIDHFPQLFADLVEYFLTEADPSTRRRTIEAALKHGMTSWQQGYELVEVFESLELYKDRSWTTGLRNSLKTTFSGSTASMMLREISAPFLRTRSLDLSSSKRCLRGTPASSRASPLAVKQE